MHKVVLCLFSLSSYVYDVHFQHLESYRNSNAKMYRCLHFIAASTVSPRWQTSRTARTFRNFTSERTRSATSMSCVGSETSPSYGVFGSRRTHVFSSTATSKFERKASLAVASLFQNQFSESALVICAEAEGSFGQALVAIFLL